MAGGSGDATTPVASPTEAGGDTATARGGPDAAASAIAGTDAEKARAPGTPGSAETGTGTSGRAQTETGTSEPEGSQAATEAKEGTTSDTSASRPHATTETETDTVAETSHESTSPTATQAAKPTASDTTNASGSRAETATASDISETAEADGSHAATRLQKDTTANTPDDSASRAATETEEQTATGKSGMTEAEASTGATEVEKGSASDRAGATEAEGSVAVSEGRRGLGATWAPGARLTVIGLTSLLVVPLVVGLVVMREPRWYPLFDMAQYELYVRDVPTHPPLLGLTGRLHGYGATGSHPGPIGFYLLWPLYQLLGTDGWSLQVSAGALVVAASALVVWLGYRRGGWPFALAVTAALALLLRGYGAPFLVEPWNPHLPVIWWVAFVLAVWSVLNHDVRAIPVAVVAGTVCMQTHVSYIPLVGGLGALAAGTLVLRAWQARRGADTATWQRLLRWGGGSAALLAVLWLPPVIQHVSNTPGNFSVIRWNFTHQIDDRLHFDDAVAIWVEHFDVSALVGTDVQPLFPYVGIPINEIGLLTIGVWVAAAVVAWRGGDPALRRLHLVVGLGAGLALLGTTRIIGPPWPYLTYWGWGLTAVMVLATVWTFVSLGADGAGRAREADGVDGPGDVGGGLTVPAPRWPRSTHLVLGAAVLLLVSLFTVDATDAEMDEAATSEVVGRLARATITRLEDDPAGCGTGCRVFVNWDGGINPVGPGLGLLAALEREGFDARTLPGLKSWVGSHRVIRRYEADLEVHVIQSEEVIDEWRERDGVELIATAQPRDPAREPIAAFLIVWR